MHTLRSFIHFSYLQIIVSIYKSKNKELWKLMWLKIFISLYKLFKSNITNVFLEVLLLQSRFSRVRHCLTPRWQPTRLPHPWDSPGKNTGVGCHFLLQCRKVRSESEVTQSYPTLSNPMDCSLPGSSIHGIFQARVLEWVAIAFST